MEWVKLYTKTPRDAAIRAAIRRTNSVAGWVFILGLCYVGEQESDGHIPSDEPGHWAVPRVRRYVDALVAEGLWQESDDGGWEVCGWSKLQVDSSISRARRASGARRSALFRDPDLKDRLRARDQDMCRYCGLKVEWGKGRAASAGSFDHVDPHGTNEESNLVVACVACNSRKSNRTPLASGMLLRPPPVQHDVTLYTPLPDQRKPENTPQPPASGGRGSACQTHKARPKSWCPDCSKPAPIRPDSTPIDALCGHGRHGASCPFCVAEAS